mmetsp:Transcript_15229/g.51199  ORF Transcript_15229/g.51199 Transcript_15229/m.51199 type:complete len:232 (+) Transcript_15229:778-1473(+)
MIVSAPGGLGASSPRAASRCGGSALRPGFEMAAPSSFSSPRGFLASSEASHLSSYTLRAETQPSMGAASLKRRRPPSSTASSTTVPPAPCSSVSSTAEFVEGPWRTMAPRGALTRTKRLRGIAARIILARSVCSTVSKRCESHEMRSLRSSFLPRAVLCVSESSLSNRSAGGFIPQSHGGLESLYRWPGFPCAGPRASSSSSAKRRPPLALFRRFGRTRCSATAGAVRTTT